MRVIDKIAMSKYTIPLLVMAICILSMSIAFSAGAAYGEEVKAKELIQHYEARDKWLQHNTSPMFVTFWLNNREFCRDNGIEGFRSILDLYEKQPTVNIDIIFQRYKQNQVNSNASSYAILLNPCADFSFIASSKSAASAAHFSSQSLFITSQ